MRDRLQTYAQLAEIIGGVAIIVSLIFVGLEVRQSNKLVATDSLREGTHRFVMEYSNAFGTEESTAFMRKATNNFHELDKDEQGRFFAIIMGFVAAFDNIYNQYEAGTLREDVFASISIAYYGLIGMPGVQALFAENDLDIPPYLLDYSTIELLVGESDRFSNPFEFLNE